MKGTGLNPILVLLTVSYSTEMRYVCAVFHQKVSTLWFQTLIFIFRMDSLVGIIDIAPTLLDIAGVVPPEKMDGKSLKPILDDR